MLSSVRGIADAFRRTRRTQPDEIGGRDGRGDPEGCGFSSETKACELLPPLDPNQPGFLLGTQQLFAKHAASRYDCMSMAHNLEVRVPFLDSTVVWWNSLWVFRAGIN